MEFIGILLEIIIILLVVLTVVTIMRRPKMTRDEHTEVPSKQEDLIEVPSKNDPTLDEYNKQQQAVMQDVAVRLQAWQDVINEDEADE